MKKLSLLILIFLLLQYCEESDNLKYYEQNLKLYLVNVDGSNLLNIDLPQESRNIYKIGFTDNNDGLYFKIWSSGIEDYLYTIETNTISEYTLIENTSEIEILQDDSGSNYLAGLSKNLILLPETKFTRCYNPILINDTTSVIYNSSLYNNDEGKYHNRINMVSIDGNNHQIIYDTEFIITFVNTSKYNSQIIYSISKFYSIQELWLLKTNTLSFQKICNVLENAAVDFNPNASEIVIDSYSGNKRDIFLVDLESGRKSRLVENITHNCRPCYSPDGSLIAFVSYPNNKQISLNIVESNGNNPIKLTPDYRTIYEYVFSHDGKMIAFVCIEEN